jgi:geranylgeranylglycerol-phosphate geranylgeranyltransferase
MLPAVRLPATLELLRLAGGFWVAMAVALPLSVLGRLPFFSWAVWIPGLAAGLLASGGYALNDRFDVRIDRVNAPWRPLPSGRLSEAFAARLGLTLVAAGLLLCATRGARVFAVGAADAALLIFYARRSKELGWLKTAIVGVLHASVFFFIGAVLRRFDALLALASLYGFASSAFRELVKDGRDIEGDGRCGARTPVLLHGRRFVDAVALATLGMAAATSVPAYLWGLGNAWLLVLVPSAAGAYYRASRLQGRSATAWHWIGAALEGLTTLVCFS